LLEALELLLDLQKIDLELAELTADGELLPERIQELEDEKERTNAEFVEREAELESMRKSRLKLERDLEDEGAKLKDLQGKQLVIKTNEEYAALSHEMTFIQQEISKTEDEILELMESEGRGATERDEAKQRAASLVAEADARIAELDKELERLNDAIAVKADERLRISMRIKQPMLARYERILESKGDLAVAGVIDGTCQGCFITLPPQMVIEIKRADHFIECQSCGRILYWRLERGDG
jgi:predicted  nucleic acid-binding Zn-ribbon protein